MESGYQVTVPLEREHLEGERVDTVRSDTVVVRKLKNGSTVGLILLLRTDNEPNDKDGL